MIGPDPPTELKLPRLAALAHLCVRATAVCAITLTLSGLAIGRSDSDPESGPKNGNPTADSAIPPSTGESADPSPSPSPVVVDASTNLKVAIYNSSKSDPVGIKVELYPDGMAGREQPIEVRSDLVPPDSTISISMTISEREQVILSLDSIQCMLPIDSYVVDVALIGQVTPTVLSDGPDGPKSYSADIVSLEELAKSSNLVRCAR